MKILIITDKKVKYPSHALSRETDICPEHQLHIASHKSGGSTIENMAWDYIIFEEYPTPYMAAAAATHAKVIYYKDTCLFNFYTKHFDREFSIQAHSYRNGDPHAS